MQIAFSKNFLLRKMLIWGLGLALLLGVGLMLMAKLTDTEKTDYAELKYKVCHDQPLTPEELLKLSELVLKSEGLNLTDLTDIREYLCANKKDYHFPDEKYLANRLNIQVKDIHTIKDEILASALKWIKKLRAKNPDIGYNKVTGKIVLKSRLDGRTIETDLLLDSFKK